MQKDQGISVAQENAWVSIYSSFKNSVTTKLKIEKILRPVANVLSMTMTRIDPVEFIKHNYCLFKFLYKDITFLLHNYINKNTLTVAFSFFASRFL